MDLGKIEMFANAQCRGAVKTLAVDGLRKGTSFGLSNWDTTSNLPAALQPPAYRPLLFKVRLIVIQLIRICCVWVPIRVGCAFVCSPCRNCHAPAVSVSLSRFICLAFHDVRVCVCVCVCVCARARAQLFMILYGAQTGSLNLSPCPLFLSLPSPSTSVMY